MQSIILSDLYNCVHTGYCAHDHLYSIPLTFTQPQQLLISLYSCRIKFLTFGSLSSLTLFLNKIVHSPPKANTKGLNHCQNHFGLNFDANYIERLLDTLTFNIL